jgi:hypothetical protein
MFLSKTFRGLCVVLSVNTITTLSSSSQSATRHPTALVQSLVSINDHMPEILKPESLNFLLSTAKSLHFLSKADPEREKLIDVWRVDRLGELNFVGLAVRITPHTAAWPSILTAQ